MLHCLFEFSGIQFHHGRFVYKKMWRKTTNGDDLKDQKCNKLSITSFLDRQFCKQTKTPLNCKPEHQNTTRTWAIIDYKHKLTIPLFICPGKYFVVCLDGKWNFSRKLNPLVTILFAILWTFMTSTTPSAVRRHNRVARQFSLDNPKHRRKGTKKN